MSAATQMSTEPVEPGSPVSILIADDHWVVRESLRHVARSVCQGEIKEASDFTEALATLERDPDIGLVVIDLMMPGAEAFEGLQELRQRFPGTPVVVISVHEDADHVLEAIRHGVVGYIPKSSSAAQIKQALSRVLDGEVSFPREILARTTIPTPAPAAAQPRAPEADTLLALHSLTRREIEVLSALGLGSALPEISEALRISRQTVRVHIGNAMRKLGISNREALIRYAVENSAQLQRIVAAT